MYLDKAKKEEIFSSITCTTAISIATVPSSRLSVFVSNLRAFCLKTLNPIILNESDGFFCIS